jgi:hypothetical protein
MDVVDEVKKKTKEVGEKTGGKDSMAKKILVPLAASAVSGATAYLARKAPGLIREKVLPKLKESGGAGDALTKAKDAVTERISSAGGDSAEPTGGGAGQRPLPKLSTKERERGRADREKRRRERKQAISS